MEVKQNIISYLKPYWRLVITAPLLMSLEVALDLMQPWLIKRIVDEGIAHMDLTLVIRTALVMLGLACVGAVGGATNGIVAARTSQGFGADLREALFRKVQAFSFGNLDQFGTGELTTRLTNDVTQVQTALHQLLRILIRAPLLLIGSLLMVYLSTPQLFYIPLTLLVVVSIGVVLIIRRAFPQYTKVQESLDAVNTVMQENLAGVRVVKAFVREGYESQRLEKRNNRLMEMTIKVTRLLAVTRPFTMLMINVGLVGVIWFGGIEVVAGSMQAGDIIAFTNYLMRTLISLMIVSMVVLQISRAYASIQRIQDILSTSPTVQNRKDAEKPHTLSGEVRFQNVSFSYDGGGGDPVLKNITFEAKPGQTIALLGATGSGKSSLVHLIPRFYDVSEGEVVVDGMDVRSLDKTVLRRDVGVALQETVLFSGTIRENIRYGRPDAHEEEVIAAAKAAQAHDFITSFPEGYDTVLGQRGVNLSGGQKQRIAIARALLLQPAILILDDSTSSVDVETESKIQAALEMFMKGRTSFVIAQRISTVLSADKILVLEDGTIRAQGTHDELMESSPIYEEIYESQLGNGGRAYG